MPQRRRKGWYVFPHVCHLCLREAESGNHIFIHCPFVMEIWWFFINMFDVLIVFPMEMVEFLSLWSVAPFSKRGKKIWRYLPIIIVWFIWEERNWRIFLDKKRSSHQLIESISIRLAYWASEESCFKGIMYYGGLPC